jgi:DeoR family transcriptional regulator, aga operon transcriptional repressor
MGGRPEHAERPEDPERQHPLAEVRQARMAGIILDEGFARVTDLAGRFGVSAVTVRADLSALEARARVRRVRGGAVPAMGLLHEQPSELPLGERPFESSQWEAPVQKSSIGVHAAAMIAHGDTVILDVGTTTTAIARALVLRTDLRGVTVVTNGLNIALELEPAAPRISVVVTGGTLRPLQHSLVNPLGTVLLERLRASVAFVGCNGVDPEVGVTNVNLPEAEVKRAMLLAARRRVIVADGSKVGEVELAKVCDIEEVNLLVTDATADPEVVDEIAATGCRVELAG